MSLRQKIIPILGAVSLTALTLVGCGGNKTETSYKVKETPKIEKSYSFAELPMVSDSGMAMVAGDFNKDGNLDLIVGVSDYTFTTGSTGRAKLYFLEGDGQGNFKLRIYTK